MSPRICYLERTFQEATLGVIAQARRFTEHYASQGLQLTLRQLYYRFVAADLIPNTERDYKRLGDIVGKARLAGLIDWDAIEDRGRSLGSNPHWTGPDDIVAACADSYRRDTWEGQPTRVEVWVEKQALEAVVARTCRRWDVPWFACKGYTSLSAMWEASERIREAFEDQGQETVILHLGDHDPSGVDMTRDIEERLNDVFQVWVRVERIALNMDQIREYRPPPNPAKLSDSRARSYILRFGRSSWELDALEPAVLDRLIAKHIEANLQEPERREDLVRLEDDERRLLRDVSARWDEIAGDEGPR